jgi:hypothetical protein
MCVFFSDADECFLQALPCSLSQKYSTLIAFVRFKKISNYDMVRQRRVTLTNLY